MIVFLFVSILCGEVLAQDFSAMKRSLLKEEITLKKIIQEQRISGLDPAFIPSLLVSNLQDHDKKMIQDWYKNEKELHARYDQFQNSKLDYFAKLVIEQSTCFKNQFLQDSKIKNKRSEKIQKAYDDLVAKTQDYDSKKSLFGSAEDYLRVLAYNNTYRSQMAFAQSLEIGLQIPQHELSKEMTELAHLLTLIPNQLEIIYNLKFRKHSPQGETPIVDAMGRGVRKMAKKEKINVTWEGLENIPRPKYDGRTVNIVAFEHANGLLDTMAQAEIPSDDRKGIGFYGVAKYVFPASWVKSLEVCDHYIVVNQGKEIPRTLEIIGAKKLQGFFASAEGLTPAGLFETRPVSPLFTNTYWALRQIGLEVNIVPMSYPKNFRLYNEWKVDDPALKSITGVVKPKLTAQNADILYELTGERESLAIWLRSVWHSTYDNEKTFLAAPSIGNLQNMIEKRLWGDLDYKRTSSCL